MRRAGEDLAAAHTHWAGYQPAPLWVVVGEDGQELVDREGHVHLGFLSAVGLSDRAAKGKLNVAPAASR